MWRKSLTNYRFLQKLACANFHPVLSKPAAMARVSVRNVPAEERMQITFAYPPDDGPGLKKRVFNFDRLKAEELEKTLVRITMNVSKLANKKKKKGKTAEVVTDEVPVKLVNKEIDIDGLVCNAEAWEEGTCLKIAEQSYDVQLNVPAVKSLTLPECILVGVPVYPRVLHEFAIDDECSLTWYREVKNFIPKKSKKFKKLDQPEQKEGQCAQSSDRSTECNTNEEEQKSDATVQRDRGDLTWEQLKIGSSYLPGIDDVGHLLKVECMPSDGVRAGDSVSTISKTEVSAGPGICPFEKRHRFTEQLMPPGVLVVFLATEIPLSAA